MLMWHCWQISASSKSVHTSLVTPTLSSTSELIQSPKHCIHSFTVTPESLEPSSVLKLGCHQYQPYISVYSIVPVPVPVPFQHHIPVFSFCTHCLAVFQSHTSISPILMAMLSDSVYKTLTLYLIWYVWISTLIFVFIVYSTSGHCQHHSELLNSNFWTIGNTLALL